MGEDTVVFEICTRLSNRHRRGEVVVTNILYRYGSQFQLIRSCQTKQILWGPLTYLQDKSQLKAIATHMPTIFKKPPITSNNP